MRRRGRRVGIARGAALTGGVAGGRGSTDDFYQSLGQLHLAGGVRLQLPQALAESRVAHAGQNVRQFLHRSEPLLEQFRIRSASALDSSGQTGAHDAAPSVAGDPA